MPMKRAVTPVLSLLIALTFANCTSRENKVLQNRIDSLENIITPCANSAYLVQSVLWFQHAPEMQALYLQSFAIAKQALVNNLAHKMYKGKKNAVVVDIDETILDNSPYEGWLCKHDEVYNESTWNDWVKDENAQPLPGALDFLNFAKSNGCEVFYVSNRKAELLEPTLQNLKKCKLPFADETHVLLKTKGDTNQNGKTTKEKRRARIEQKMNYEIVLLCGDQLGDFNESFETGNSENSAQVTDSLNKYEDLFGSRYIVLPNPMYNDWLNKIIKGSDKNNSCYHMDSLRMSKIKSWK